MERRILNSHSLDPVFAAFLVLTSFYFGINETLMSIYSFMCLLCQKLFIEHFHYSTVYCRPVDIIVNKNTILVPSEFVI